VQIDSHFAIYFDDGADLYYAIDYKFELWLHECMTMWLNGLCVAAYEDDGVIDLYRALRTTSFDFDSLSRIMKNPRKSSQLKSSHSKSHRDHAL